MLIDDLTRLEQAMAVCILVIALGALGMIGCAAEWVWDWIAQRRAQTMPADWVPAQKRITS